MRERKNVVLLFSKVPEVGLVKTRLTTLKDGIFTPETASVLYHCMLFDVVEIIMAALDDLDRKAELALNAIRDFEALSDSSKTRVSNADNTSDSGSDGSRDDNAGNETEEVHDTYELVISTTPAENVEAMRKLFADAGTWPRDFTVIADEGASFDEHYNNAFEQCWEMGADCILSMGADMPALTKADVRFGFEQLHRLDGVPGGGIVISPDQEMGVSVIGWTRDTDFSHTGVFYNADGLTVLPAYIKYACAKGLPALWLPPIPDVDTMQDFFHNVTLVHALNYCADFDDICPPWRTANAFNEMGFEEIIVTPNDLHDPREHIDK